MTRCSGVEKRFRAYIDGDLTTQERQRIDAHLAACHACHAHLEKLDGAARLARTLALEEPPPHFSASLQVRLASLRAARRPLPWWRRLPPRASLSSRRLVAAGAGAALGVTLLVASLLGNQQPGVAEIAERSENTWSQLQNYSCVLVTSGIYRGQPRRFEQKTWFQKPGNYRFETRLDYPLQTVLDGTSVRYYLPGGSWRGRGPLLIVGPRIAAPDAMPFPFGVTSPAGPNATVDSLLAQLRRTRDAELVGIDRNEELQKDCYVVRFQATPPRGVRPELCTLWIDRESLVPLRIARHRDRDNDTLTEAEDFDLNTVQPSNTFEIQTAPGTFVVYGDVDPHVFGLLPADERTARFDTDPLAATRQEVAERAPRVPFPALVPEYLPAGYRLVRVRCSPERWLESAWIDDRAGTSGRLIRLSEQSAAAADPVETRGGRTINVGTAALPLPATVREGTAPYAYCYVSWRRGGTLLTLFTAELGLDETLKLARSLRVAPREVPAGPPPFVGPPRPSRPREAPAAGPEGLPAIKIDPDTLTNTALLEPPLMPETAEEDDASRSGIR